MTGASRPRMIGASQQDVGASRINGVSRSRQWRVVQSSQMVWAAVHDEARMGRIAQMSNGTREIGLPVGLPGMRRVVTAGGSRLNRCSQG